MRASGQFKIVLLFPVVLCCSPEEENGRLAACRQFYAKMVASGGSQLREDLERAFEIVPREYFLGAGPWFATSSVSGMLVPTPTDDPIHVKADIGRTF